MTIENIAGQINKKSGSYNIGKLQSIRKEIKKLKKRPIQGIFSKQTITKEWAFHVGGRSELQFNIAYENEGLRYGFAFSLATSRSLPNLDILYPKILKLNTAIIENALLLEKYKMWCHGQGKRSAIADVKPIGAELVKNGNFIFIGKIMPNNQIDIDEVLKTFDELLDIYIEVESDSDTQNVTVLQVQPEYFLFKSVQRNLPKTTSYTSIERQINVEARHTYIQEKLIKELISIHGTNMVAAENYIQGKKIDVVVKINNNYIFYEVKTANSAKACVRQAIGQLLEYSYFNCKKNAIKIVVVGEHKVDTETSDYLAFLQVEFNLPIEYKTVC